ncbi:c-type cytochrome [Algibacillus agarilyticus]|uniref:c-type cytochrome n=1 Tax=Algibacillus agarilyticus TaxID=2234133 RepID=UPI0018E55649|nr:c-type cytochrome [Algibacillus agarilyticus]
MLKHILKGVAIAIPIILFIVYAKVSGLFASQLKAPEGPAFVKAVPDDWAKATAKRESDIAAHLLQHQENFDHFANFPVSQTHGIPLIVLKLLPKVAPEFWGNEDNFLSVMGLFNDERLVGYPFPRGIGFTGLVRQDLNASIDFASFTCGGCHIGRLRLENGEYQYLDGGVNQEFNVVGYRQRIVQTLNKIYANETDRNKKNERVIKAFLNALNEVEKTNPTYFYNNYQYKNRQFTATYEAKQIALFKQNAEQTIIDFINHQERVYDGWLTIANKFYPNISERIAAGFAGMEDAIGFNAASAYQSFKDKPLTSLFAPLALPGAHGITDIMVVWDQDSHDPRWNEDGTRLIDGGGQWTGHIPLPIYKNIAAQVTLGFDNIDVSVSAHAEKLLRFLPPPIYPFDVDIKLAKKGQALFAENCADCHQPNNGRVYQELGTDMGRANVAGTLITVAAQSGFTSDNDCSPTTTVTLSGQQVQPCATYRGVSLKGQSIQAMLPPWQHQGYNALPLPGIWAQAPYLHNGSVPTLYHLLVPEARPTVFVKSRLEYDQKYIGFKWQQTDWDKTEGYLFDTASSPSISNQGHDKDITLNGKTFKLDWSQDKQNAWALIEYLKTL